MRCPESLAGERGLRSGRCTWTDGAGSDLPARSGLGSTRAPVRARMRGLDFRELARPERPALAALAGDSFTARSTYIERGEPRGESRVRTKHAVSGLVHSHRLHPGTSLRLPPCGWAAVRNPCANGRGWRTSRSWRPASESRPLAPPGVTAAKMATRNARSRPNARRL